MFNVSKEIRAKKKLLSLVKDGAKNPMIELIEEFGFSVNIQGEKDAGLLHESIIHNQVHIFDYLLSCDDIDVNIKNGYRKTALMLATEANLFPYVDKLLKKGALTDIRSQGCNPVLITAAKNDNTEILKVLLKAKANIDIMDRNDETALIWAAYHGYYNSTKLLLEHGADIYIKNSDGEDASFFAQKDGGRNVVELIEGAKKEKLKTVETKLIKKHPDDLITTDIDSWFITDEQEISHMKGKKSLGRTVTEIFNFQAETLITIIENDKTHVETMVKEPLSQINEYSMSKACQEYQNQTDEEAKISGQKKMPQAWNNLNNNN